MSPAAEAYLEGCRQQQALDALLEALTGELERLWEAIPEAEQQELVRRPVERGPGFPAVLLAAALRVR
jgi:hypothetical protein